MFKSACTTIGLLAFVQPWANPALAAGGCATPADAAALKTAVMQQELMVAAFQCREADAYNRFVTTFRGELQSSDAALKAFFIRRGGEHGEAGYDSFKTKAANLSALEQARHSAAFCADAHALYAAAFAHPGSLMSFVESRTTDIGNICVESRPTAPLLADVRPQPSAPSRTQLAEIGGVPAHSLPALPYRRDAMVAEDARSDDDGYPPRAYGPPPNWRQDWRDAPPRYGWYPREAYGR
jgi:hypothetical protein